MFYADDQPIIACATGTSLAALAIIRISGMPDLALWNSYFSTDLLKLIPRTQTLTKIKSRDGKQIYDQGLITFFPAPHSYTGENLLELTVHGNPAQVQRIMDLFIQQQLCRYAQAGEFTQRAIKNKKMTLAQAEGLDLFYQANAQAVAEQGLSLLFGGLYEQYWRLRQLFLDWSAAFNLFFDFLEDVGSAQATQTWQQASAALLNLCQSLAQQCQHQWENFVHPTVVLLGPPNAGKSSLFNTLLQTPRAIIHEQAGTTRDYLAQDYAFAQNTYRLIDTAGIWAGQEAVEKEGIARSLAWKDKAFFKILVLDPTAQANAPTYDLVQLAQEHFALLVLTHADQTTPEMVKQTKQELVSKTISYEQELHLDLSGHPTAQGKQDAPGLIWPLVAQAYQTLAARQPLAIERHRQLILEIAPLVEQVIHDFGKQDLTILEMQIKIVAQKIEELVGIVDAQEIIDQVLAKFCIGK
ncbi:MAG: 50S ribosome-binding GTPase [Bacteriovoracaceae bacterium]|nr:50S ribosome-binding GTPase [Bacteriovoracaceae bacterium]